MREMKDSGIEWIGKIPKDWKLIKIGNIYDERNMKVSDKDYEPLSVTKNGVVPQLESAAKSNDNDNRKLIRKNDFVINSRSDRRGSCGISNYDGSCSLINTVLKPRDHMINQYYNYVFRSELFADEFYKWGNGIVNDLWSTKWSSMKKIYIPFPKLTQQQSIANYLDDKCEKIDRMIAKEQEEIDKLKEYKQSIITEAVTKGLNPNVEMKDSGIEWIGEIPCHWTIVSLKHLGSASNGLTYSPNDLSDESGTLVLRSSNIKDGKIDMNDCVYVNSSIPKKLFVRENDLFICSRNGSKKLIGKNALITKEQVGMTYGAFMCIFRSSFNDYIHYSLNSSIFGYYLGSFLTSTINQLTNANLYSIKIPFVYDKIERQQIINYLDEKCHQIDLTLKDKQKQLKALEEYKKSLIYECVTGKKEVL